MTTDERQICDNIYQYISNDLENWTDSQIFAKTSFAELGELYYNRLLSEVEFSSVELLNAVIRTIKPKNYVCETQEEYYIALCKILGFKKLPSEVWVDVDKEYNEIFVNKYGNIEQKYQREINRIDAELIKTKNDAEATKNTAPTYSFMRDITTDEQKLYELNLKCNSLRTRKEMLSFMFKYVSSQMSNFCDMHDAHNIEFAKKQETLNLSKNTAYDASAYFSPYRDYMDIAEDDLDRPYALFFKVKIYVILEMARKQYHSSSYTKSNEEAISEYNEYINNIPKINDLQMYKIGDPNKYNTTLDTLISDYNLINQLQSMLVTSVCLRERKNVLLKAVDLYTQREYEIFNNILPIQIEGMFSDFLKDTTTFLRFSKMDIYSNAVLKDKIRHLQEIKSDIYPEAVEYFMYFFNNMIRNRIAHGRYTATLNDNIQDEIFSKELILDMVMLVHMLSRKCETENMYRFINGYKKYYDSLISSSEQHKCFGALFNDMIGDKTISSYDTLEKYRPIQVAYWIVNPYYEKIFEQVCDKKELIDLREEFLSKEFWEYVLERLNEIIKSGHNCLKVNMEFLSIVKGMFKCNVETDVKPVLAKVNAALLKIREMQAEN